MVEIKITSPLWKPAPNDCFDTAPDFSPPPILAGEAFACHVLIRDREAQFLKTPCRVRVQCDGCTDGVSLYRIGTVPVRTPCYPDSFDDGYLSCEAGLYHDVMYPTDGAELYAPQRGFELLRIEVSPCREGDHRLTASVLPDNGSKGTTAGTAFEVLPTQLPVSDMFVTQWLHADCIAERYGLEPLSDRHFEYLERAVRCAVKNGISALYTPLFTPPLDTEVGGERLTVQLVGAYYDGGKWSFDYTDLDRWCDMGLRCGVKYFEMSHLFTQWGAHHAPKIIASVNGVTKRVFGWETDAASDEYTGFLRVFLTDLLSHMRSRGLDRMCVFHISDEPSAADAESYRRAADSVRDVLAGYTVADALSDVSLYRSGACAHPIPGIDHAADFLEDIPKGLWVYYCCSQSVNVSNRFIAMPLSRVRVIGIQMWRHRVGGFLHWGYNFYSSQYSRYRIDPFVCTDGDYFAPAGDAFSVYPGDDGEVLMSLRLRAFREALDDMRALEAAEAKCGRDAVIEAVEGEIGYELTFDRYPTGDDYIFGVRRRVAELLKQ